MSGSPFAQSVEEHYRREWGRPVQRVRLSAGRVADLPADFAVLVFHRSAEMRTYATRCMSQPGDAERVEFHMFADPRQQGDASIIEILTAVAHYHRTAARLSLGHSVNFGKPWLPGSLCDHGLVSLPYLDGPALEWLQTPQVRFLWLIPISGAEMRFKKENGLEALEAKLELARFNYLEPLRPSVV